jgi:hypothetical protein
VILTLSCLPYFMLSGEHSRYKDSLWAERSRDLYPVITSFPYSPERPEVHLSSCLISSGSFSAIKWLDFGSDHLPISSAVLRMCMSCTSAFPLCLDRNVTVNFTFTRFFIFAPPNDFPVEPKKSV